MKISIIAAIARNGVIGNSAANALPWTPGTYPEDMKHFRDATMGHAVVMGRNTWESIPARFRPLPGRTNIVVSREYAGGRPAPFVMYGAWWAANPTEAFQVAGRERCEKLYVIGGSRIYAKALLIADELDLTLIDREWDGDVKFPEWSAFETECYDFGKTRMLFLPSGKFESVLREPCPTNPELTFTRWVRR